MKIFADKIFTRDELTAQNLKQKKVPAFYLGNPMMDNFDFSNTNYALSPSKFTPGSPFGSEQGP
jgi:hypothetical protein